MELLLPGAKIVVNCISCLGNGGIRGWPCRFSCSERVGENLERKQSRSLSSIFLYFLLLSTMNCGGRPKKIEGKQVCNPEHLFVCSNADTLMFQVFIKWHFPALVVNQVTVNAYFAYLNQSLVTHLYLKIELLYLMSHPSKNVHTLEPCLSVLLKLISITDFLSFCSYSPLAFGRKEGKTSFSMTFHMVHASLE